MGIPSRIYIYMILSVDVHFNGMRQLGIDWIYQLFYMQFMDELIFGKCGFHMGFANFGDQDPPMVFFLRKWSQKASNTDVFCTWGLENPNDTIFLRRKPKKNKYQALLFYEENLYGHFTITTWDKPFLWAPILGWSYIRLSFICYYFPK